jgi:hypothetical protein
MEAPFYFLLVIGHLGLFDVLYFHQYKCSLMKRIESRLEVKIHLMRHVVYALQFLYVANFRASGSMVFLVLLLYICDFVVAMSDVWIEPESRKSQGGLPRGEYLMHILLTFLVGMYFMLILQNLWNNFHSSSEIALVSPNVPHILILYMNAMCLGTVVFFLKDLFEIQKLRQL